MTILPSITWSSGISSSLVFPRGNPNSSGVPQIIVVADSLGQGYQSPGVFTPFTGFWSAQNWFGITAAVNNLSIGGQTIGPREPDAGTAPRSILDLFESNVVPLYDYFAGINIIVIGGGTNDMGTGRAPAEVNAFQKQVCVRAHQLGAKAIIVSLISRASGNGNGSFDSQVHTINTYNRDNWTDFADAFVDYSTSPYAANLDTSGAYADTAIYQADGIHLQTTGYQMYGNVILARVQDLLLT